MSRPAAPSFRSGVPPAEPAVRRPAATPAPAAPREHTSRFRVEAEPGGLLAGIAPSKLNQINDELQDEELVAQMRRDGVHQNRN